MPLIFFLFLPLYGLKQDLNVYAVAFSNVNQSKPKENFQLAAFIVEDDKFVI